MSGRAKSLQDPHPMTKPGPTRDDARADFGERQFRDALAEFATGVTIIATRDRARAGAPRYVGFTANSFNSVSLEPPLVSWCLSRRANTLPAFERCERYAISVLAVDQVDLAWRFAGTHADRFEGVPFRLGWADAPLIDGAVAWFECRHFSRQAVGDHTLFVGEVMRCARAHGPGLVFHHGGFCTSAPIA
jgi:flavin reductase (DIM6/NTAB) family NADH-FMN oxidoreductase RutF